MKRTLMAFTIATTLIGITFPATAQSSEQYSLQPQNSNALISTYGRVAQVNENQFVLNSNLGQITVSKQQPVNLNVNEPVTVTGTLTGALGTQSSTLNAYSITRSDGTNITFTPTGALIQSIADSLNS
jgi:hypothetical protein